MSSVNIKALADKLQNLSGQQLKDLIKKESEKRKNNLYENTVSQTEDYFNFEPIQE